MKEHYVLWKADRQYEISVKEYREVVEGQYDLNDNLGDYAPDISSLKDEDSVFIEMSIEYLTPPFDNDAKPGIWFLFSIRADKADGRAIFTTELPILHELVVVFIRIFGQLLAVSENDDGEKTVTFTKSELVYGYESWMKEEGSMKKYLERLAPMERFHAGAPALYSTIELEGQEQVGICFTACEEQYSIVLGRMYIQYKPYRPEDIKEIFESELDLPDVFELKASFIDLKAL